MEIHNRVARSAATAALDFDAPVLDDDSVLISPSAAELLMSYGVYAESLDFLTTSMKDRITEYLNAETCKDIEDYLIETGETWDDVGAELYAYHAFGHIPDFYNPYTRYPDLYAGVFRNDSFTIYSGDKELTVPRG